MSSIMPVSFPGEGCGDGSAVRIPGMLSCCQAERRLTTRSGHVRRGFLYEGVAVELRKRIESGVYAPGGRIPSEAELIKEFRVSAITVRRAIRDLMLEGLLRGRQGLGVFVSDARRMVRSLGGDLTTSIGDDITRAGRAPGIREVSAGLEPAPDALARRLRLKRGTLVYRYEKIILADGEPVGLDVTYLPRALGDTRGRDLEREFVFPLAISRGIRIDHIDFTIEGGAVGEQHRGLLGLPLGFPLLVVDYAPIGPDGAPILAGRISSRYDRFAYAFRVQLPGEAPA